MVKNTKNDTPESKAPDIEKMSDFVRSETGQPSRFNTLFHEDGYVNMLNKYGTSKDMSEYYTFQREDDTPIDTLVSFYEGNGLFAKVIDAPAEEAVRHGFELENLKDNDALDIVNDVLDELDWEESFSLAIKWARLFGGAIAVMLIDDGRALEEPVDWRHIESVDGIKIYDRSVCMPDIDSMFRYTNKDHLRTNGGRLGTPEYYHVYSKYGFFKVHESRCLVFRNDKSPEHSTNFNFELWGIPEYNRIQRVIRDTEIAHGSAVKMLDRSVQAIYSMKDLSLLLQTEEGEDQVKKRLEAIDMARGLLNSITIDAEGESYDFRSFSFNGVAEVIDTCCNQLSAITSIPQSVLFGRSPAGMNATGASDLENYYNFVQRIQKRMMKGNLRYLIKIILTAARNNDEIESVPKIVLNFKPLWSLTEAEQVQLDQNKAQLESTKAQTISTYLQLGVISPEEIRLRLGRTEDFTAETLLDGLYKSEKELMENMPKDEQAQGGGMPQGGMPPDMMGAMQEGGEAANPAEATETPPESQEGTEGKITPDNIKDYEKAIKTALQGKQTEFSKEDYEVAIRRALKTSKGKNPTKRDYERAIEYALKKSKKKKAQTPQKDDVNTDEDNHKSVGVIVISEGKILCATRTDNNLICGPGGHIEKGEKPEDAAFRETLEEFNIVCRSFKPIGFGPKEYDSGNEPYLYVCDDFICNPKCLDGEMKHPRFVTLDELVALKPSLFDPFRSGVTKAVKVMGLSVDL